MNVIQVPFTHPLSLESDGSRFLRYNSNMVLGAGNIFSIMCAFKPISSTGALFVCSEAATGNRVQVTYNANSFLVELRDSGGTVIKSYTYNSGVVLGDWNHVVVTWDGTTLLGYLNGQNVSPTTITTDGSGTVIDSGTRRLALGATIAGGSLWQGYFSQVAVWNSVLSAAEITSIFNEESVSHIDLRGTVGNYSSSGNLQHWWLLGSADRVDKDLGLAILKYDLTTNGTGYTVANATLDAPTANTYNRWGLYSIDMDGVTERFRSVSAINIGISNAWTVLAIIKSLRDTTQETIFEIRAAGTLPDRIRLQKRGDLANAPLQIELCATTSGTTIKDYSFDNALPTNQWLAVLATWDGTSLNAYINGQRINPTTLTTDTTGTMGTTSRSVGFGIGAQADQPFRGLIHSFAIWDTNLSIDQIKVVSNLYNTKWMAFNKNGFGYTSAADLVQWVRCALGSITSASVLYSNEATYSPLVAITNTLNLLYLADVVRDAPGDP